MAISVPEGTKLSRRDRARLTADRLWRPDPDSGLEIPADISPAEWIAPLLVPESFEVRMTVPGGFDAYARMFFPFSVPVYRDGIFICNDRITWKEMAQRNHRLVHPLIEQETITVGADGTSLGVSADSQPTPEQIDTLLGIVSGHTASTMGWFLLWDGYGGIDDRAFRRQPKIEHDWRDYYLLQGPLGAFGELPETPSYWWPDDRAWCWCTDTDFAWAYLAGSAACIDAVVALDVLDAVATSPENPARSGMDVLNDPDGDIPRR